MSPVRPAFYDLARVPAPQPLDIVWTRWPINSQPGFKDRPALVHTIYMSGSGEAAAQVVYGTSKLNKPVRAAFIIQSQNDLQIAGLEVPTRFHLAETITLPWSPETFIILSHKQTPVLGHLPNNLRVKLRLWAAMHGFSKLLP